MIERCFDYRRVKRLAPEWDLCVSSKVYYMVEVVDGVDMGVIVFVPDGEGLLVHVEMTEQHRGRKALKSYKDAFAWIFRNTDHRAIVGKIPKDLRAAQFMARHAGATLERIDKSGVRCYSMNREFFEKEMEAA